MNPASASTALSAPDASPQRRSAFRRYAPTVAMLLAVALCVTAGSWQRERMAYKLSLKAQHDTAVAAAPLRSRDLPLGDDWSTLRYRIVELEGAFDARLQILLDNQVREGRPGYDVLTPFTASDGRVLLVDRGWVPLGRSRSELPVAAAPAGTLTLRGYVDLPARGYLSLGAPLANGPVWQHVDLARFAEVSGLAIAPVIVRQTAPAVPGDNLLRTWPAPDFGIDTHRIYMVQWYAFALLAVVFWAATHWRSRYRTRKHDVRA